MTRAAQPEYDGQARATAARRRYMWRPDKRTRDDQAATRFTFRENKSSTWSIGRMCLAFFLEEKIRFRLEIASTKRQSFSEACNYFLENLSIGALIYVERMCKSFLVELDLFADFGWIISRPAAMLQLNMRQALRIQAQVMVGSAAYVYVNRTDNIQRFFSLSSMRSSRFSVLHIVCILGLAALGHESPIQ